MLNAYRHSCPRPDFTFSWGRFQPMRNDVTYANNFSLANTLLKLTRVGRLDSMIWWWSRFNMIKTFLGLRYFDKREKHTTCWCALYLVIICIPCAKVFGSWEQQGNILSLPESCGNIGDPKSIWNWNNTTSFWPLLTPTPQWLNRFKTSYRVRLHAKY